MFDPYADLWQTIPTRTPVPARHPVAPHPDVAAEGFAVFFWTCVLCAVFGLVAQFLASGVAL